MIIEFTGIPGAGKSTLIESVTTKLREQGLTVQTPNEYIFSLLPISPPSNPILSTLLIDIILIPWVVRSFSNSKSRNIMTAGIQAIARGKHHPLVSFNLHRNFLKKIGVYTLLNKRPDNSSNSSLILWDEGITHSPQLLFVNKDHTPKNKIIREFLEKLPLPSLLLFLDTDVSVALDGITKRGSSWNSPGKNHRMGSTKESTTRFLKSSKVIFDMSLKHWGHNPNSLVIHRDDVNIVIEHMASLTPEDC
jgi:hypothetical protein